MKREDRDLCFVNPNSRRLSNGFSRPLLRQRIDPRNRVPKCAIRVNETIDAGLYARFARLGLLGCRRRRCAAADSPARILQKTQTNRNPPKSGFCCQRR